MNENLKKIILDLRNSISKHDEDEASELMDSLEDSLKDYHVKFESVFSNLDETIKKNLDPTSILSLRIDETQQSISKIQDSNRLEFQTLQKNLEGLNNIVSSNKDAINTAVKESNEILEATKDNTEEIDNNKKIIDSHIEGIKLLDKISKNFKLVASTFSVSLGAIIVFFWLSINSQVTKSKSELSDLIKTKKSELSKIIDNSLETSSIVRKSTQIVNSSIEERYLLGGTHRAIAYTNDAIYKLDRLAANYEFHNVNPFKVDELRAYFFGFRKSLIQPVNNSSHSSCDKIGNIDANVRAATALSDWTSGFIVEAFRSLKAAYDLCGSPEILYMHYYLDFATSKLAKKSSYKDSISFNSIDLSRAYPDSKGSIFRPKKSDFNPKKIPYWIQFLIAHRIYELCDRKNNECQYNDKVIDAEGPNSNEIERLKNLISHVSAGKDANLLGLFKNLERIVGSESKIRIITSHYKSYLEWDEAGIVSRLDLKNKDYLLKLIDIQSVWPTFLKPRNNFVARFHPCFLNGDSNAKKYCGESTSLRKDNPEIYFEPIDSINNWKAYLEEFRELNKLSKSHTITDSLVIAYLNVVEYAHGMRNSSSDGSARGRDKVFEGQFISLTRKLCNGSQIKDDIAEYEPGRKKRAKESMQLAALTALYLMGREKCQIRKQAETKVSLSEGCRQEIKRFCPLALE